MRKFLSRLLKPTCLITWLTLLVVLSFSAPVFSTTYYVRNDGTGADPDCSGSSACCVGAYNEAGYNAATFIGNDVIRVCPHGGPLNLTLVAPSSGTSGNEIILEGVYDPVYGWPVLNDGLHIPSTIGYNIVRWLEIHPGVAVSGTKVFEGGRFGDCDGSSRDWKAGQETAVIAWNKTQTGLFAVGIGAAGGSLTPTPQLYWRDKTDASAYVAVSNSGEVVYTDPGTCLTDEDDVIFPSESGITSGKTGVTGIDCEQENSHQASLSTSLSENEYTELHVGISFANADDGHEYQFALFESGAQVGNASAATIRTCGVNSESYTTEESQSRIAAYSSAEWMGAHFTDASTDYCICKLTFRLTAVGTISGYTFYSKIGEVDSNGDIETIEATSNGVTGNNGWDGTDVEFAFTECVPVSKTKEYALVVGRSSVDDSNHIEVHYDAASPSWPEGLGVYKWDEDGSLPWPDTWGSTGRDLYSIIYE